MRNQGETKGGGDELLPQTCPLTFTYAPNTSEKHTAMHYLSLLYLFLFTRTYTYTGKDIGKMPTVDSE